MEKLNGKIGAWLLDPKHTKAALADALGIHVNTLTSRLSGETEWYLSEAIKVCKFIGFSIDELV